MPRAARLLVALIVLTATADMPSAVHAQESPARNSETAAPNRKANANDGQAAYGNMELLRDSWGVPHVFADTDAGAMYGLGYAAAEDRGFQMHYFLRIVQGRMSEFLGIVDKKRQSGAGQNNTLEHDQVMRAFGFAAAADKVVTNLDDETRGLLEAYSAGVNAYFTENANRVHYLFEKTGLVREPWKPADCILSWWHFAQFFAKNGLRDKPALTMPPAVRGRGGRIVIDDDAAVVRREDVSDAWIDKVNAWLTETGLAPGNPQGPATPDPKFSHAWVVGGKQTTTGAAVLVSDPQTPVWNPSMLYEFHAQGASFNARGVGVAGSPIILIGFNPQVAWGVTALGADQADIFILKTDDGHPNQYQVDGQWLDMISVEEVIQVKDAEPVKMTVRNTIFGPIVSEFVWQNPPEQEVALARVPMVELDRDTIQAAIGMMRADSCETFAAALPGWRFPTANCVFGDSQGNIGYWSLGALPIRSASTDGNGNHAQDGTSRKGMWQGMIPYDILPHCINPKRGYLVTANHRTIQSFYQVPFGIMTGSAGDTDRGLRIKERIQQQVSEQRAFTPEDVLAIHFDAVNVWKREIVRLGYRASKSYPTELTPNTEQALDYLKSWYQNGACTDLAVPGTELVNEISVVFRGNTSGLVSTYGGGGSGLAGFAKAVRARDANGPSSVKHDDEIRFIDQVLDQAWRRTQAKYGPDTSKWNERAKQALCRQTMAYMESLDGFPTLDSSQNVSMPLLTTIDGGTVLSQRAQSYTQYVPLHDADTALSILPIGSSDNPSSPFRFSTYGDWSRARLHPAPLSRQAVDKLAVSQESIGPRAAFELRQRASQRAAESPRRAPGRQPQRGAQGRQGAQGQRGARRNAPQPNRTPLPGKKPDDPTLEMAIRYLNRQERTEQEVADKIKELKSYVASDQQLQAELVAGLELFTHLMRESAADRLPIKYGTPTTLKLIDSFYQELRRQAPDK